MPYHTGIRLLCVAQNPANGFPARLLGVDTGSVTNWEKNHHVPMLTLVTRIIEFLGYALVSVEKDSA